MGVYFVMVLAKGLVLALATDLFMAMVLAMGFLWLWA